MSGAKYEIYDGLSLSWWDEASRWCEYLIRVREEVILNRNGRFVDNVRRLVTDGKTYVVLEVYMDAMWASH